MKKFLETAAKILVALGMIAGIMFAIVRYWDSILECCTKVKSLFKGRKNSAVAADDDFDDWVD